MVDCHRRQKEGSMSERGVAEAQALLPKPAEGC